MTFFKKKHPLFILLMLIKISCHECPSNGCANCGPFLHSTALIFSHDLHSNGAFPLHRFFLPRPDPTLLGFGCFPYYESTTPTWVGSKWGGPKAPWIHVMSLYSYYGNQYYLWAVAVFFFSNQWTALCWCRFFDSTGTRCHRLMGKLLKWEELNR